MEQQDKYYTPNIEDIRVGYECEIWEDGRVFIKGIITEIYQGTENTKRCLGLCIDNGNGFLIDKYREIKTPYLIKEQIEAEGWNHISNIIEMPGMEPIKHPSLGEMYFNKGAFSFNLDENKEARIARGDGQYIYIGSCPSINEFRIITKLLNIK